mmetsp:Transcript_9999/g.36525  ORF Transcript_9999/g.36525 Transcript_9999/m.36525 type:complete len:303 (-) Transcript_9999:279-1187(-)
MQVHVHAQRAQLRVSGRGECPVRARVRLLRAVAAHQLPAEAHTHLGELGEPRDADGIDQVLARVGAGRVERKLGSCEDNRLAEARKQKRHGAGGVGERVCAVNDDEAVVVLATGIEGTRDEQPLVGSNSARVQVEEDLALDVSEARDLRHGFHDVREHFPGLQASVVLTAGSLLQVRRRLVVRHLEGAPRVHAQRAARVQQQHLGQARARRVLVVHDVRLRRRRRHHLVRHDLGDGGAELLARDVLHADGIEAHLLEHAHAAVRRRVQLLARARRHRVAVALAHARRAAAPRPTPPAGSRRG